MRVTDVRLHRTGAGLLLAIGTSFSMIAYAGAGVWTSGGPSGGGNILALAIDPKTPATLYAGTSGGVLKSTDSGGTWAPANTGLTNVNIFGVVNANVYALAINPASPATLYAGTTGGGISKSTDSGGTWAPAGGTWAATSTGLKTNQVTSALAIDPASPSTLYAGGGGVSKSTDSGSTWFPVNTDLSSVSTLAINPSTPSTLYAGTSGGVFRTTDSGETWTGLLNQFVHVLAINPSNPATLYAGTRGGIFKSTNSGGTWAAANAGLLSQGIPEIFALAIDPATPTTLYAGTYGGGVFKSTDSGSTWAIIFTGVSNVYALAINPITPATLYTGGSGLFKSADSGGTWVAANVLLKNQDVRALVINPATPATLYAGGSGAFKSTDSGGTWASEPVTDQFGQAQFVQALIINSTTPSTLYAGTGRGVFKSTDSGGTWAAADTGLTNQDVRALAINPATPSTLYAGTRLFGIFKSTDSGGAWAPTSTGLPPSPSVPITYPDVYALALHPATPATLYAGTFGFGVFKSTDSGGTWTAANTGLTDLSLRIYALAIDPATPATLYAGTGGGVFKSTDSGGSWAAANKGLSTNPFSQNVYTLAISPSIPTTLYAGAASPGVFKSTDSGGTWAAANKGLPYFSVQALALDPTGATTLYAGLASGSVWQSTPPTGGATALLPTSSHAAGVNGAFYTTNVSIADTGTLPASFTLKFLGNNGDGSNGPEQTFTIDPGKSLTFVDVLGSVFNQTNSFGAIRITSNTSSLNIVSVTSTPGFRGTFGQTIPAVSSSDLIPAGFPRSILYIREGDGFRSNLILASNAFVTTIVDAALVSPTGSTLATKSYYVPPSGMTQLNRIVTDMGVSGSITGARLVLSSSTPGAAFTGFASVIDETTNDPTTVLVQPAAISGSAPYIWLLPTSAHSPGANNAFYTTNASISNVGAAPATFTMKFLGNNQDGSNGPEKTFNLDAGKSVTYFDVLGSVFNETSNFGAIRITSSSPSLNIVSITSTPGFGGTFGQTIPAVPSSDLIPSGSPRSILYVREGDGFRSNLILASSASVSTAVDATLVSPAGTTLATKSYSVPANGMTQINRIVRDMGISGAITGARLVLSSSTPNSSFTAFASVIDEATNDPTTVEAR